jgi:hypothetical protein
MRIRKSRRRVRRIIEEVVTRMAPNHDLSNHSIYRSYKSCDEWGIERTERWLGSAIQTNEVATATGYLLALALKLGLVRNTDALRNTLEHRLPLATEKSSQQDLKVILEILVDVTKILTTRPDFDVADKELDLVTAATLRLIDAIDDHDDPSIVSVLHAIGNVYQSQLRYSELSDIRRRELLMFKPKSDRLKGENRSLFQLWQEYADAGNLDKAQLCLNELCEQIAKIPNLGSEALCDLLLDLTAISFAEEKPERVDLLIDAAIAVAQGANLNEEAANSAAAMLEAMSAQLELQSWWHEAIRLSKQSLGLMLDKMPSTPKITRVLKKTLSLIKRDGQQVNQRSYFKSLQQISSDKEVPADFKNLLEEQTKQSDEVQKLLDEFQAKEANDDDGDPEKRTREITNTFNQSMRNFDIAHLQPILKQMILTYRQSPLATDQRSSAHHIWHLAQNFSSQRPTDCAPFLEELTAIAVERINQGELVRAYSSWISHIRASRNKNIESLLHPIYSALLTSQSPENRLDGLQLLISAFETLDESAKYKLFDDVVEIAPESSRAKDGDECYAIAPFLELSVHLQRQKAGNSDDQIEYLLNRTLKYFNDCANDNHTRLTSRQLWNFAEHGSHTGQQRCDFAIQLFTICDHRKLEQHDESELDRSVISCVGNITRNNREDAENLLLAAIDIRESTKGAAIANDCFPSCAIGFRSLSLESG